MKIAFVSQPWNRMSPPVQIGSVAILTYEAAKRLAHSCDVVIYGKRFPGEKKVEQLEGVRYRRVATDVERKVLKQLNRFYGWRKAGRPVFSSGFYYFGYALQVARDLRRHRCDVVQLFNFSQFANLIRALNPEIKIALHMSSEWLTQIDPLVIRPRLQKIDAIIAGSDYITSGIRAAFPELAGRCYTLHSGRKVEYFDDTRREKADDAERRLLYVGRVSPEKGVHVLIDAFKKVLERFPQTQLDIVGPRSSTPREFIIDVTSDAKVAELASFYEGRYIERLQDMIPAELAGKIAFRGAIPHCQLTEEYRAADVFVYPSIIAEASAHAPIEAMAAGVPVISTRTGGTAEYVDDGKTGVLVEPGDAHSLAEAMLRLLENRELRESIGAAGKRRAAERFSYDRFVCELLELYGDLCERNSRTQWAAKSSSR